MYVIYNFTEFIKKKIILYFKKILFYIYVIQFIYVNTEFIYLKKMDFYRIYKKSKTESFSYFISFYLFIY